MTTIAYLLVVAVIFLHVGFLIVEMFFWEKDSVQEKFGLKDKPSGFAFDSKVLAKNQGLYNGFLAAGLLWGLSLGAAGTSIKVFFLVCVIVAGVFGGLTAKREILFVQALPGAIALALTWWS